MADETEFVVAYDKRTGKKLPNRVPPHFVEAPFSDALNLSATPRGKAATAAKQAEAAPAEATNNTKEK